MTYTCSESSANEEFVGWLEKVGIKTAAKIKQAEQHQIFMQRIVGGAIAPINYHPYLAGLLIDINELQSPAACGGSILTPASILTAAHCWFDGRNRAVRFTVVLGTPFLFHGGLRIQASSIAVHHQYDFRTFANDIAMLYLPRRIIFNHAVQPIPLATDSLLSTDKAGMWAVAAGYGRYSDVINPTTNTMARNVFLQTISLETCRGYYGNVVLDSNICTSGVGGVGICRGDSGGPLTINHQGKEWLIGVSSFVARDGCELGFPSVFASVPSFRAWIQHHMIF